MIDEFASAAGIKPGMPVFWDEGRQRVMSQSMTPFSEQLSRAEGMARERGSLVLQVIRESKCGCQQLTENDWFIPRPTIRHVTREEMRLDDAEETPMIPIDVQKSLRALIMNCESCGGYFSEHIPNNRFVPGPNGTCGLCGPARRWLGEVTGMDGECYT